MIHVVRLASLEGVVDLVGRCSGGGQARDQCESDGKEGLHDVQIRVLSENDELKLKQEESPETKAF